jgi:AraC family transcriptional regulator
MTPNMATQNVDKRSLAMAQSQPLSVVEVSAAKGQWDIPAAKEVSLALSLSNFSARWRGSQGFMSEAVSAGTLAICELDRGRIFEMRDPANFAIVLLRNEVLHQVGEDNRDLRADLQAHEVLQDLTLRQLMKVLVRERRAGFPSGTFFLDGVATALASYLVRNYSTVPPVRINSSGGMAPSILRRCVELMEARLEKNLRLNELAQEAGLSTSHFVRSFRESTGKTPYQFLLHRRVERARDLMRDHRASLTEVALASGFADQHHLARVFRRITNLTPSDYRRSLQ